MAGCAHVPATSNQSGRTQPFILGAEPAGAELHAYIEPSRGTAADVERALREAGFAGASLRPINPSLEDVFIALIRREERHAAA